MPSCMTMNLTLVPEQWVNHFCSPTVAGDFLQCGSCCLPTGFGWLLSLEHLGDPTPSAPSPTI